MAANSHCLLPLPVALALMLVTCGFVSGMLFLHTMPGRNTVATVSVPGVSLTWPLHEEGCSRVLVPRDSPGSQLVVHWPGVRRGLSEHRTR